MIRILIFVAAGFLLFKLLTGDKRRKEQVDENDLAQKVAAGEMVRDPICGSFVSKDSDIRVRQGDKVECFCSFDCRDKYIKRLEKGE